MLSANILHLSRILLMCQIACISCKTSVQISTCDAPLLGTPLTLCCFTEHLPTGASVYFSNLSGHVVRIGPSCDLWYQNNTYATNNFKWNCSSKGNVTVYMLAFQRLLSVVNENEVWQCGFYGNKAETTLTVLDYHAYGLWLPGTSPLIQFTLIGSVSSTGTLRLFNLQSKNTLLEVDLSNNKVLNKSTRIEYTGNIAQKNFSAKILNLRRQDNGTYVCVYSTTDGNTTRMGFTVVVIGKPSAPEIRNTTKWKVTGSKVAGSMRCEALSGSSAPLFYKPVINTQWFIPSADDWPKGDPGYNVSTNGSLANMSNVNCGKMLLPIYCRAKEQTQLSDSSQGFFPQILCTDLGVKTTNNGDDTGDPVFRSLVIGICFSVTSTVFVVVITLVVARRHIKKKLKRCCKCFRRCCRCCADSLPSSSSDSDSDFAEGVRRSRHDIFGSTSRRRRRDDVPALADGLRTRDPHTSDVQQALERIAIEESRQNYELFGRQHAESTTDSLENPAFSTLFESESDGADAPRVPARLPIMSQSLQSPSASGQNEGSIELVGAVGGSPPATSDEELTLLKEVESLLERHHRHLNRDVVTLQVSRDNIVENLIGYYTEESLALSRVTVKFLGEEGMDCGGVTFDMFTTFWSRAQDEFFIGCEAVVPYLPPHRFTDDSKYRVLGRILSHSIAVMKAFPIPMCKSTLIALIYETTEASADTLLEDFLYFLDEHDRSLVTTAINDYSSLTTEQTDELMTIFERYDYAIRISADNFKHHVTQLARHVTCIRPRPLLDLMRAGIPQKHLQHFWSCFHLKTLDVLFRALKPTAERVIARLKISEDRPRLSGRQGRVFKFLKDLLKEMSVPELETFLHFVTGKKSIPRDKITIEFTSETGKLRLPKAHTCSNMMELPESYEDYDTFRSEVKHLLASDEALKMSME